MKQKTEIYTMKVFKQVWEVLEEDRQKQEPSGWYIHQVVPLRIYFGRVIRLLVVYNKL